jgi:glucose-6-phosphate 1-dehydrogenase
MTIRSDPVDTAPSRPSSARNPLRAGLRLDRMPEPCTMVIVGATGDLTDRKLAPALYNLMLGGALPPEFTVVGFARRDLTAEQFRAHLRKGIDRYSRNRPVKASIWESFSAGIEYQCGEFHDEAAWAALAKRLARIDRDRGTSGNRLF